MRKICPGCRKKFWRRGGTVRFPDDTADLGYYEIDICKDCAEIFEKIDQSKKELVREAQEHGNNDE